MRYTTWHASSGDWLKGFNLNESMSSDLKPAASQPPTVILISLSLYRRLPSHLTDWPKQLIELWPLTPWHSISWSCRAMSSSAAAGHLPHSRPQCCGRGGHFMQPESLEEARDWLTRAQRDFLGAGRALSGEPILADLAVFHAQQAMEKALKAFLAAHDQP